MVESNNVVVLGPNRENLPQIVAIFAEAIGTTCQDHVVLKQRIKALMTQMQSQLPEDQMQMILNALTAQQKVYLRGM